MTTYTPRLGLPFIEAAQAQKHVTHNAALERLDTIVQLQVQQFGAETPPTAPLEGQSWALGTDPTGVWAGQTARIATFSVSIRRRPLLCPIDQTGFGTAFGLRGFGAHFLARRSKLSRMRPISASSGSNCPPYHSRIRSCSSCLGSAMASRNSA